MPDDGSKGTDEVKITVGAPAPGGVVAAVPAPAPSRSKASKVHVAMTKGDTTVEIDVPCRADDGSVTVDLPPLTPGDTITIEAL